MAKKPTRAEKRLNRALWHLENFELGVKSLTRKELSSINAQAIIAQIKKLKKADVDVVRFLEFLAAFSVDRAAALKKKSELRDFRKQYLASYPA